MSLFSQKPAYDFILAGLGNPGPKYEQSRHNTGFTALDMLAERLGAKVREAKFEALCGTAVWREGGEPLRLLLLKPMTFMNLSGRAVAKAARYYHVAPERIIVFFDDVSLPVGRLRVRPDGSAGGHNGVKSLIEELRTEAFPRVKIGVGECQYPDLADWVLAKLPPADGKRVEKAAEAAGEAALYMLREGVPAAMSRFNGLAF